MKLKQTAGIVFTVMLAVLSGFAHIAAAEPIENLLINGDFEPDPAEDSKGQTPSGWTGYRPEFLELVEEARPGSPGKQCLKINGAEKKKSGMLFSRLISFDAERDLKVSGWMRTSGKEPGGGLYFLVNWYDEHRKPIVIREGTGVDYESIGGIKQGTKWHKRESLLKPFAGEYVGKNKESIPPLQIPPDAVFFMIKIFTLNYAAPVWVDDIVAAQELD